jgi:predicted ATPase/DNA-binding CsgD family transcriptional regulator
VAPLPLPRRRLARAPLRTPLTSLIGRERADAEVCALLNLDEVRLLTLTGPGGVGKTRLALRIAEETAAFPDGVVFVDLAQVRDPAQVVPAIARALDAQEATGPLLYEFLHATLVGRRLLLVLDNLEQVLGAAPRLAGLLTDFPSLTILATSRELLHVSGEHDFPVPPLSLGKTCPLTANTALGRQSAAEIAASDAVRLFVERAQAVRPDFALDGGNVMVVAEICRRVDGLPLGIELAAARMRHLSAESLLCHLDPRLPLLTGGPRDSPARLRTMHDAIAWSHDLLTNDEQELFRQLAVFEGGFTLPAAEAVASRGRPEGTRRSSSREEATVSSSTPGCPLGVLDSSTTLDLVASLVDKNLLRVEGAADGETRYGFLETVREFGLERLAESRDEAMIRDRHARWCRFVAAQTLTFPLRGTIRPHVLDRLETEVGNLRAALTWHARQGEAAELLDLATALTQFWSLRGFRVEGSQWLERALAMAEGDEIPPALHAAAFHAAAALSRTQDDLARAVELAEEALARFRALDDNWNIASVIGLLGILERSRANYDRATRLHEEALALFRDLREPFWVALAHCDLGMLAHWQGDERRAVAQLGESVAGFRELDDPWGVGLALSCLALVTGDCGDHEQAAAMHVESLGRLRQVGSKEILVDAVARIATLAVATGRATAAARLLGAAEALGQALGYALERPEQARYARAADEARADLGDERLAAAWAAGRALSLDEAIAEAQALQATPSGAAVPAVKSCPVSLRGLTGRETEILHLLVAGDSNREIGQQLFISPTTVARHVANICGKLGVDSRTKATAYAHRHGIG